MWISLINADMDGIKKYAKAMNCENLHGLFACMLTARSWKAVSAGIDKHEFSEAEVKFYCVIPLFIHGYLFLFIN